MYKILDDAGITIMRVGLKSTDIIGEGGAINGGTYHPAFRQLVEGEIAKERIEPLLRDFLLSNEVSKSENKHQKVSVYSSKRWFSDMIGHHACNRRYFTEEFPSLDISFSVDDRLPDGIFRVASQDS